VWGDVGLGATVSPFMSNQTVTSHDALRTPVIYSREEVFMAPEPLLDVPTTAKILGLSIDTIRLWVSKGRIEYVKLGSRVMFRPESIRSLINSSVREAKQ
jgi:excisionase family DNA binding protein